MLDVIFTFVFCAECVMYHLIHFFSCRCYLELEAKIVRSQLLSRTCVGHRCCFFPLVMNHRFFAHLQFQWVDPCSDGNGKSMVMRFITKDTQWCIWFTVSHDKDFKSHLFGHLVKRCKQLLWCLLVKCRVIQVLRCHAQEFGIEFPTLSSLISPSENSWQKTLMFAMLRSSTFTEMATKMVKAPNPHQDIDGCLRYPARYLSLISIW